MGRVGDGDWYLVESTAAVDELDVISGALWAHGAGGIEERPQADGTVLLVASVVVERLDEVRHVLGSRQHRVRRAPEPESAEPVERALVIAPGVTVRIAAGPAFGWGGHVTTRLALELLAKAAAPGLSVLDVGTGSGVLAVAAARMGASRVTALDIDPVAVRIARANVDRNAVTSVVEVIEGSADAVSDRYDVVVANLDHPTLLAMARTLTLSLASGGQLVVSGFLEERLRGLRAAFDGVTVLDELVEGGWAAFAGGRADCVS